ncbi:MAG: hypothetical protein R2867_09300 [Caldilineaceae bacterium]
MLDGINQREVELAVTGWGYTIGPVAPSLQAKAQLNSVYCIVNGLRGLPVRVHAGEWSSEPVYTGTAPEVGDFGCELTGLEAGHYIIAVDGVPGDDGRYTQLEARIAVDKKRTMLVEFVYAEMLAMRPVQASQIKDDSLGISPLRRLVRLCISRCSIVWGDNRKHRWQKMAPLPLPGCRLVFTQWRSSATKQKQQRLIWRWTARIPSKWNCACRSRLPAKRSPHRP